MTPLPPEPRSLAARSPATRLAAESQLSPYFRSLLRLDARSRYQEGLNHRNDHATLLHQRHMSRIRQHSQPQLRLGPISPVISSLRPSARTSPRYDPALPHRHRRV